MADVKDSISANNNDVYILLYYYKPYWSWDLYNLDTIL